MPSELLEIYRSQVAASKGDEPRAKRRRGFWLLVPWLGAALGAAGYGLMMGTKTGWVLGFVAGLLWGGVCVFARQIYCAIQIHPLGINGHNSTRAELKELRTLGLQFNVATRAAPFYFGARFVHGKDMQGVSPAFVLFILALLAGLWFYPLALSALILILAALLVAAFSEISVPTALYLGSSSRASHEFLARLKRVSDIRWTSLLTEPPVREGGDALLEALDNHDAWSLRCGPEDNWREVVRLYLMHGPLVVLRASERTPYVADELDMIQRRHLPEIPNSLRQFVIACSTPEEVETLAEAHPLLRGRIITEEAVLGLLGQTMRNPVRVRERLAEPNLGLLSI